MNELFVINKHLLHNTVYFGSWVRKLRKQRGYSQKQLGMAVGKSHSWICELEKGRRGIRMSDPQFYIALAEYLNVPLNTVLDAANIPKNKKDIRYHAVYKMVRNRSIAQRIINITNALESTSKAINVETTDYGAKIRHLSETLQIQIQDLKSVLRMI